MNSKQWEQAVAAAWRAIQKTHPELAEMTLASAQQQTVPCADTDTDTTVSSAAVQTAIRQAASIETPLDDETTAHLVGEIAMVALLHLAAHALAAQRGVQETINRGLYHSRSFVLLASEVGLDADMDVDHGGRGYHHTTLADNTCGRYAKAIEALAAADL